MTVKKPIWSEGLFVCEHHLQQQDRYHESYVDERLRAFGRPSWGVSEILIDTDALAQGQFRLRKIVAILPDGTPIDADETGGLPESRDLNDLFGATRRTLPVLLGLPLESSSRANVGEGAAHTRMSRESGFLSDYNDGGREQELSWAAPRLRLLAGDESREGFTTIQIADLLRTQSGALVARDTFVPPCFSLQGSDFLVASARRIASAVATRARAISASRIQRTESRVEFSDSEAAKMLLLMSLNRALPQLNHFAHNHHLHPEDFHVFLASFAGELCTFVANVDPSTLPRYSYLNLGDSFEALVARILSLLSEAGETERYVEIPLKRREDGMYLGRIEDSRLLRHHFFLAARSTLSEAELHQQLPKLSKIASWGQIASLLNSAVHGARIELEFRPSSALPVRPGVSFFKIQKSPEYWQDIMGTGTIAIYHTLGADAVTLSLYAVDQENL